MKTNGVASKSQTRLVGRDPALRELQDYLYAALGGSHQVVFITGEAGIGKSALVDEFERQANLLGVRIGRGQCIEGYGSTEPYYPMLQSIGELCQGPDAKRVVEILTEQAPTWLVQFPELLNRALRDTLLPEIIGTTRERMLREIRHVLRAITADNPLMLIFEDVQWADPATVDLISALARDREPAKFLFIGTYRTTDVASIQQPLQWVKQELLVHHLCHEIALPPLEHEQIAEFLGAASPELAELIYSKTAGNPLFVTAVLEHMQKTGAATFDVPERLRQFIETQLVRLPIEQQRILEAASVAGISFKTEVVAPAMNLDASKFEEVCQEQSRHFHVLRPAKPPASYEFVHSLYRDVLYQRQPPARRAHLHRQIGKRLEVLFADRLSEVAAQLAHHFELGSDWVRAARNLELAAQNAARRFAHQEAAAILEHALAVLKQVPERECAGDETRILDRLATMYIVLSDLRATETYEQLRQRAASCGLIDVEARALIDLAYPFSRVSADYCLDVIERSLQFSDQQRDPLTRARTRASCFVLRIWAFGWNSADAEHCRKELEEIRRAGGPKLLATHLTDYSLIQWVSSEYRAALQSNIESVSLLNDESEENSSLGFLYRKSQSVIAWGLLFLGDLGGALQQIEAAISMLNKNGDPYRAQALRLYKALVQLIAMDFDGVVSSCEAALRSTGDPEGVYPLRLSLVLRGSAETGLGNFDEAREHFLSAQEDIDRRNVLFDWYWRMALESGLTELWLAMGDLTGARAQADRFIEVASNTAERTWQGLAWEVKARVALAEADLTGGLACIEQALQIIGGFELPLAEWRVHGTAGELYERTGEQALAQRHRELSRSTIMRMANSLEPKHPLRATFLSAAPVRHVLTQQTPR
ncbi:MAG TPA: AAA family ATPase [Bryobacteraceae bacterium]|nr:AAA family ATPase [Bryobacteraceae bacterium]